MGDQRAVHQPGFTSLEDAFGRAGIELAERCHDARGMEERFAVALGWVAERVARAAGLDRAVGWCATQIEQSGGLISIARLRERIGFSAPRLLAAFRELGGITARTFLASRHSVGDESTAAG